MSRAWFCVAAALLLSGCSTLEQEVPDPARYKTVALVSAMPETLRLNYTGLWEYKSQIAPVDWNINQAGLDAYAKALRGRYEIKATYIDATGFRDLQPEIDDFTGVARHLREVVKSGTADIIIVADGTSSTEKLDDKPVGGADFGFAYRHEPGTFVFTKGAGVGISYTIEVFDGTTFAPLGFEYGGGGGQDIDDFGWRGEPYATLTDAQRTMIRYTLYNIINDTVPQRLKTLKLID